MKKLLIIDGNSIINRAFYGIKLLTTKDGMYTNGIYGFLNIMLKHIEQLEPEFVATRCTVHTRHSARVCLPSLQCRCPCSRKSSGQ